MIHIYIYKMEVQGNRSPKTIFRHHPSKGSSFSDHLKTVLNMVDWTPRENIHH